MHLQSASPHRAGTCRSPPLATWNSVFYTPADGSSLNFAAVAADEGVRLAVACDDGVTRFFGVDEGVPGLTYQRSLGRVEGRALSIAWHPAGATLFSGHSDAIIRAWNATNGREIYRIDAGAKRTLQGQRVTLTWTLRMSHRLNVAVSTQWGFGCRVASMQVKLRIYWQGRMTASCGLQD